MLRIPLAVAVIIATAVAGCVAVAQGTTAFSIATNASLARFNVPSPFGAARLSLPFRSGRIVTGPGGEIIAAAAELDAAAAGDGGLVNRQFAGRDGLDVERFPTIGFQATSITQRGESLAMTGDLTIREVTRPIRLAGRVARQGNGLRLTLEGEVDRTQFGIMAGRPLYSRNARVGLEILAVP